MLFKKKKKVFTKIFQAISKKKKDLHKNFSSDLHKKTFFQKNFQALHKNLIIQKIVQSSSRGQANFRGLEASRPRSRTSKCVLEAKNVLEDSTSDNHIPLFRCNLIFELCWAGLRPELVYPFTTLIYPLFDSFFSFLKTKKLYLL